MREPHRPPLLPSHQAHTNESVQSLKTRVAALLKLPVSSVQLLLGDSELDMPQQLLHRAGVTAGCRLTARGGGPTAGRGRDTEVGVGVGAGARWRADRKAQQG